MLEVMAILGVVAIAQTIVILTGGIDMSTGAIMYLMMAVAPMLMKEEFFLPFLVFANPPLQLRRTFDFAVLGQFEIGVDAAHIFSNYARNPADGGADRETVPMFPSYFC